MTGGYCPCRSANVSCSHCLEREEIRTTAGQAWALRDAALDLVLAVATVVRVEVESWRRALRRIVR